MSTSGAISVLVLLVIAMPFLYYSEKVNKYGAANEPEGFKFPHIRDFWRVLVGAAVVGIYKVIMIYVFTPLFATIAKGVGEDAELEKKHTRKATDNF